MRTRDYKRAALAILGALVFNLFFPLPQVGKIIDAVRAPVMVANAGK
jgi:hypothetical protein